MKKRAGLLILSGAAVIAVFASALVVYAVGVNSQAKPTQQAISSSKSTVVAEKPTLPTQDELLTLVNAERAKAGVPPLQIDQRLSSSAQRKVDDEAKYNYFGHVSPNDGKHGYEYINDVGIACKTDSENLHQGTGEFATPGGIVNGWMGSPAHKAAMLDAKYSLTGFGISLLPDGETITVVEHFCQQ